MITRFVVTEGRILREDVSLTRRLDHRRCRREWTRASGEWQDEVVDVRHQDEQQRSLNELSRRQLTRHRRIKRGCLSVGSQAFGEMSGQVSE